MSLSTHNPSPETDALMRSIIQRVATGPELSKDISFGEARAGMRAILDGIADPVQAAIFLIGLRMKRETDDEARGVLQALLDVTDTATATRADVVNIADPYDGCLRMLPAAPFLPAVLAACGVATVSHGVADVGPKHGVTHRRVLQAAGLPVDLKPSEAAARLDNPDCGWAYVDQARFCPALHALTDLRRRIVKRPVLTTAEVLLPPVRGAARTHLLTGYVHKPYPRIYCLLARHAAFDSALIVRGVEGGVIPSLQKSGRFFYYHDGGEEHYIDVVPTELDIHSASRAVPIPEALATPRDGPDREALAGAAAEAGMAALQGAPGAARDALVFCAATVLWHLKRAASIADGAVHVRHILDNGAARARSS